MEQTMTKPTEQEPELLLQATQLLQQHPVKQVLGNWLSPHELRLAEELALDAALQATPGDPQLSKYYPLPDKDDRLRHLMGS
ncbi:hypothetical protein SNOUR_43310 [Streptomyces noursei ATCC 11455]|uniref:hypothetical protein n=1 Tax=Streptomyces noursei TaxID=1971 RepID=UPI00081C3A51|nr:hypothetical protein SNOUR_00640 [Streptomyces noursei ATCC 11455]ANZ21884.1 hypothetical protein SNOUR_43310 [Streptomyces noursei ATCC 11455]